MVGWTRSSTRAAGTRRWATDLALLRQGRSWVDEDFGGQRGSAGAFLTLVGAFTA